MKVSTALIFAAGYGSRMLPVTAAVQKELLPIGNRPIVDYVVDDCIAAGITRVIFVVQPGALGLREYYEGNPALEAHLARYHKTEALAKLKAIHRKATFEFIEQPSDAGYGTAVPLRVAASALPAGEAFLVSDGDVFLWHADGRSELKALVSTFGNGQNDGAIMTLTRSGDELSRYGVLSVTEEGSAKYLKGIVEKPAAGAAPSNLVNISKYILTPQLLPYVMDLKPNAKLDELLLTDALAAAAAQHRIVVHHAEGDLLDAGSVSTWLEANQTIAGQPSA